MVSPKLILLLIFLTVIDSYNCYLLPSIFFDQRNKKITILDTDENSTRLFASILSIVRLRNYH